MSGININHRKSNDDEKYGFVALPNNTEMYAMVSAVETCLLVPHFDRFHKLNKIIESPVAYNIEPTIPLLYKIRLYDNSYCQVLTFLMQSLTPVPAPLPNIGLTKNPCHSALICLILISPSLP